MIMLAITSPFRSQNSEIISPGRRSFRAQIRQYWSITSFTSGNFFKQQRTVWQNKLGWQSFMRKGTRHFFDGVNCARVGFTEGAFVRSAALSTKSTVVFCCWQTEEAISQILSAILPIKIHPNQCENYGRVVQDLSGCLGNRANQRIGVQRDGNGRYDCGPFGGVLLLEGKLQRISWMQVCCCFYYCVF